jgi:hypothetical protein
MILEVSRASLISERRVPSQCAPGVHRDRDTSPIAVNHDHVTARLTIDFETVATKNCDELAGL